jgi:endonuclease-3
MAYVLESLPKRRARALRIIDLLRQATKDMSAPASTHVVAEYGRDPYLILVACILSLRTKDTVSLPAARRLFVAAKTPQTMLGVPLQDIQKLIYPSGFYRQKSKQLHAFSTMIIDQFKGKVPRTEQELLMLPGVGRKTANLVLGEAFGIPAICVDTHVHRISNRLGLVSTKTAEETEMALKELLPPDCWIEYNKLLVMWGQNICVPIAPLCSQCPLSPLCPKIGVTRRR